MKLITCIFSCLMLSVATMAADRDTLKIDGNNTSSSYVTYNQSFSIPAGHTKDVLMARYCYFSSTISGTGTLNLHGGGDRCYLGTAKGAAWPNWTNFKGDIHIYPYKQNSPSAGFWGVVLAHGGKTFSPENVEDAVRTGKVNKSMENNHVTLHNGATMCCEANANGAGFRIGELQTEEGSSIIGYMKKNTRAAYFLVGCMNTNATLAGTIAPPDYSDTHPVGIIKEGSGVYRITGNQNYLSGTLRILEGRVLADNDAAQAKTKKLRGALGAKPNDSDPIAYVFSNGILGGAGSIGGTVDNYGTVEPGSVDSVNHPVIGTLTLQNFVTTSRKANLVLHPVSVLRFKLASTQRHDQLSVAGDVKFSDMAEDFSTSDKMPLIEVVVDDSADVNIGDEFTVLTAKGKTGDWQFELQKPEKYTWAIVETQENNEYQVKLQLVSFEDQGDNGDDNGDDNPDQPGMGSLYDDGIDDNTDTHTLRYYADKNNKKLGVAISSWKGNMEEGGKQFNMLVAENEMKMETLQPSRGQFSFGSADNLVSFAKNNKMTVRGHCLVWHQQQPTWLSSDGKKNDKNWSRAEALQIMKDHITTVLRHFKGKVVEWDVVNECLDDDQSIIRTNPEAYTLRQNVWQRAIGDDYIDSAFVYAHQADSTIKLYLNDYDVEFQGKAKSVAFYNLAMKLKNKGIPLDGVGLQCHFSVGDVDSVKLENTIRRFGENGLKCIVTELDMGIPSTTSAQLEEQARNYRVITDIVLNNDNCPNMVIWGIKDNDSWRSASTPLLYTSGLGKKKAWYAVRSALRHRALVNEQLNITPSVLPSAVSTHIVTDLSGRQVRADRLRPGIYIKGGKKIAVSK